MTRITANVTDAPAVEKYLAAPVLAVADDLHFIVFNRMKLFQEIERVDTVPSATVIRASAVYLSADSTALWT
ncbi:hypothetical protein TWF696_001813 [Orbilia brochopaga]|uniref:Uncharacterized protein n=1 Tax=Orbilia brochopaga TaxID=3140254 RepID=A0AAV9U625_9PEZI